MNADSPFFAFAVDNLRREFSHPLGPRTIPCEVCPGICDKESGPDDRGVITFKCRACNHRDWITPTRGSH